MQPIILYVQRYKRIGPCDHVTLSDDVTLSAAQCGIRWPIDRAFDAHQYCSSSSFFAFSNPAEKEMRSCLKRKEGISVGILNFQKWNFGNLSP